MTSTNRIWTAAVSLTVLSALLLTPAAVHAQSTPPPPGRLVVAPGNATLDDGASVAFEAFFCTQFLPNGDPDPGPDGQVGNDPWCTPAFNVSWIVSPSPIGNVSPATGPSTIFTATNPGSSTVSGSVIALDSSGPSAAARVIINGSTPPPPPPPPPPPTLIVTPASASLFDGDQIAFEAFEGTSFDANGDPDFGNDGVPGGDDDFVSVGNASWSVSGSIGSIDPPTGPTGLLTASTGGAPTAAGQVVATTGTRTATADVTVIGPPSSGRATFLDASGGETDEISMFETRRGRAFAISILSRRIESLAGRRGRFSQFRARIFTRILLRLINADFRYRGAGVDLPSPPTSPTAATITTSFAADGSVMDQIVVDLQPAGAILRQADQLVVVSDALFDVDGSGSADTTGLRLGNVPGLVFMAGELGGRVTIEVIGLDDGEADIVAGQP